MKLTINAGRILGISFLLTVLAGTHYFLGFDWKESMIIIVLFIMGMIGTFLTFAKYGG